jgi:hypothetical protein
MLNIISFLQFDVNIIQVNLTSTSGIGVKTKACKRELAKKRLKFYTKVDV